MNNYFFFVFVAGSFFKTWLMRTNIISIVYGTQLLRFCIGNALNHLLLSRKFIQKFVNRKIQSDLTFHPSESTEPEKESVCPALSFMIRISMAKNTNGEWKHILNLKDPKFSQVNEIPL